MQVQLCLKNQQDFPSIKAALLLELKRKFLTEDIVDDMKTFGKLGTKAISDLRSFALATSVVLFTQKKGILFIIYLHYVLSIFTYSRLNSDCYDI